MGAGCGDRPALFGGVELRHDFDDDMAAGAAIERETRQAAHEAGAVHARAGRERKRSQEDVGNTESVGSCASDCLRAAPPHTDRQNDLSDCDRDLCGTGRGRVRGRGGGRCMPMLPVAGFAAFWHGTDRAGAAGRAGAHLRRRAQRNWTPQLLDILASHDVRATFFLLGSAPKRSRTGAAHCRGRTPDRQSLLGPSQFGAELREPIREELTRTQDTLEQITGAPVKFFRPPFGARRPAVFRIAREMGLNVGAVERHDL